jgi:hypothetical protein
MAVQHANCRNGVVQATRTQLPWLRIFCCSTMQAIVCDRETEGPAKMGAAE